MTVVRRAFVGIGSFLVVATLVYGAGGGEAAGVTMLLLSAVLALGIAAYLWASARLADVTDPAEGGEDDLYLPHASIWPFWMGVAALLLGNGLALGLWAILPGAILLALAAVGFAAQSRARA